MGVGARKPANEAGECDARWRHQELKDDNNQLHSGWHWYIFLNRAFLRIKNRYRFAWMLERGGATRGSEIDLQWYQALISAV